MTGDQFLSSEENEILRSKGLLEKSEVACRVGDIVVAVNPVTGARRLLSTDSLNESIRRPLRD